MVLTFTSLIERQRSPVLIGAYVKVLYGLYGLPRIVGERERKKKKHWIDFYL